MEYIVELKDIGKRLDVYVTEKDAKRTRSYIKKNIDLGKILVNKKLVKSGYLLKQGDIVTVESIEEKKIDIKPKKMDIDIVYEDDDIIVINKAKGVVVHPRKW